MTDENRTNPRSFPIWAWGLSPENVSRGACGKSVLGEETVRRWSNGKRWWSDAADRSAPFPTYSWFEFCRNRLKFNSGCWTILGFHWYNVFTGRSRELEPNMNPEGRESAERDNVEDSHAFETRNLIRLNTKCVTICIINEPGGNIVLRIYGLAVQRS